VMRVGLDLVERIQVGEIGGEGAQPEARGLDGVQGHRTSGVTDASVKRRAMPRERLAGTVVEWRRTLRPSRSRAGTSG
jgi:hypothetical protein